MAKRDKEERKESSGDEVDSTKLTKLLIKEFNDDSKVGKIAWNLGSDLDNPTEVKEFISFGSLLLDYIATNRRDGGAPVGKLTEISGEEASGKSLLCAHLIANCQKKGGLAVYIDTENAANPAFMEQCGVDVEKVVYLQPGTIEEVGNAIEKTILMTRAKSPNKLVLVVWDSVAGTPSQAEIEGTYDPNDRIGVTAKALAKMMRKLTQVWGKERICMVFTNQLKTKIGVMYGDPMQTPGGKAIPYHASLRVRLTRSSEIKVEEEYDPSSGLVKGETKGVRTLAKVVKGRFGPPLRKTEFNIMFASGVDDVDSWFTYLHQVGEIEKADGWCYLSSYPSGKLEEKGVHAGKDRGVKFRERGWKALVESDLKFKAYVLDLLEKHLVIKFRQAVPDQDIDPESLMDVEAVKEAVTSGQATAATSGS